mgnify:CR=1 FL=1|jgi:hypothetical protein
MREKYQKLQALRKKVKSNKNYMAKYQDLKKLNQNDEIYGWRFENDDVLEDSIFNLEDYTPKYLEVIMSAYLEVLESVVK